MDVERGLFEAILNNPEDLVPRLVYADWCDERGDPRGEFIRVQCELVSLQGSGKDVSQLRRREMQLLADYRREWNGEIHRRLWETPLACRLLRRRGLIPRWRYHRGFVEFAVVEARAFLEFPETLFQIGPLRRLHILRAEGLIREIVSSPHLARLRTVELDLPRLRRDVAEREIQKSRPAGVEGTQILPIHCRPIPRHRRYLMALQSVLERFEGKNRPNDASPQQDRKA